MLGERIRKIRKQKKMTLEALAGKQLTKGMLSLIENNKSKPSIESLTYIAEQLGVEVSDLLEEISIQELREILEQAEKIFNTKTEEHPTKYSELIDLIDPFIDKLVQGYEAARLLEIYSRSLYYEKNEGWQETCDRAANMYDQMNLTAKRASISNFRSMEKFVKHEYDQSLEIFIKERNEVEAKHPFIDSMTRLELDYHEAILHFAVGDSESATRVMENAIKYSKENRIFYLINDLYRLAAAHAMMTHDHEKRELYKKKLKQYGEFADDIESILFCELFTIMSLISEERDYSRALDQIEHHLSDHKAAESYGPWLSLEKGRALYYLGRYEESIQWLDKVFIPTYVHHPFDFSIFYVMDSYRALSHLELGNLNDALASAELSVSNFNPLPPSSFKEFSLETYEKVRGIINLEQSKK